jgi:hypothetical protein
MLHPRATILKHGLARGFCAKDRKFAAAAVSHPARRE